MSTPIPAIEGSSSRLLKQLQVCTVSILILPFWQVLADAAAALAAAVCNLGSSAKSLLLLLRHVHWTTASQLAAIWHGAMRSTSTPTNNTRGSASTAAGCVGAVTSSSSSSLWWWTRSGLLQLATLFHSAGPAATARDAVLPSSSGRLVCQHERHMGLYPRRAAHQCTSLAKQQQQVAALQALAYRLPVQLPRHQGLLTVALDLDETLVATYRLTAGSDKDSLQLVPSSWPVHSSSSSSASSCSSSSSSSSWSSSSSGGGSSRRSSVRPAGTPAGAAAASCYSVSTARACDAELAALLGAHGGATLLHYTPAGGSSGSAMTLAVFERPGVREFLGRLSQFAELVLFTAGTAAYAEPLADLLDPTGNLFRCCLFGDATVAVGGRQGVKDLSGFGRELSRVVLVDNNLHSFMLQPANGLPCPPYHGGGSDSHLLGVILPLLASLSQVDDIRPLLASKFRVAEWLASKGYAEPGATAGAGAGAAAAAAASRRRMKQELRASLPDCRHVLCA